MTTEIRNILEKIIGEYEINIQHWNENYAEQRSFDEVQKVKEYLDTVYDEDEEGVQI